MPSAAVTTYGRVQVQEWLWYLCAGLAGDSPTKEGTLWVAPTCAQRLSQVMDQECFQQSCCRARFANHKGSAFWKDAR